ncbi:hypothetical protein F9L16_21510 [Agarivorans sp. B2Z047]|uniref:hypothetical protein n=1 Tax=Agarivorans sp. B2Z047 TaxID=2652721 RepID=UPI00128DAC5C|nr:hypothetical protein [Agarivorans sp. B2Z047]MPW31557.1 hypothetical protein [Agarivorans sp. B2Z047]UQN42600.1 hypothetical protein LQZ07_22940 [Agarivorans sp. B2Z047]
MLKSTQTIPWSYLRRLCLLSLVMSLALPLYRWWLNDRPKVVEQDRVSQDASAFLGKWQGSWSGVVEFTIDFKHQPNAQQIEVVLQHVANAALGIDDKPRHFIADFKQGEVSYRDTDYQTRYWFKGSELWAELTGKQHAITVMSRVN